MKYLVKFENTSSSAINIDTMEIQKNTEKYLSSLPNYELDKIYNELEILARKHNIGIDKLQDPNIVSQILSNPNESFSSWLMDNWYYVVDKLSKYGKIFAAVSFVGTMLSHYLVGNESVTGIKVAVAAYIISSMVGTLKKLKD